MWICQVRTAIKDGTIAHYPHALQDIRRWCLLDIHHVSKRQTDPLLPRPPPPARPNRTMGQGRVGSTRPLTVCPRHVVAPEMPSHSQCHSYAQGAEGWLHPTPKRCVTGIPSPRMPHRASARKQKRGSGTCQDVLPGLHCNLEDKILFGDWGQVPRRQLAWRVNRKTIQTPIKLV